MKKNQMSETDDEEGQYAPDEVDKQRGRFGLVKIGQVQKRIQAIRGQVHVGAKRDGVFGQVSFSVLVGDIVRADDVFGLGLGIELDGGMLNEVGINQFLEAVLADGIRRGDSPIFGKGYQYQAADHEDPDHPVAGRHPEIAVALLAVVVVIAIFV